MKFTMHMHTYVSFQNSLLDVFLPTSSIEYRAFFLLYFFLCFPYDILSDTHSLQLFIEYLLCARKDESTGNTKIRKIEIVLVLIELIALHLFIF